MAIKSRIERYILHRLYQKSVLIMINSENIQIRQGLSYCYEFHAAV
jgi:hypothetical protein